MSGRSWTELRRVDHAYLADTCDYCEASPVETVAVLLARDAVAYRCRPCHERLSRQLP